MAKQILLRFEEEDNELLLMIERAWKKMGVAKSSLAKHALFEYCKKILETRPDES